MFYEEANWLHDKKKSLIEQLLSLEAKSHEASVSQNTQYNSLRQEADNLQQALLREKKAREDETGIFKFNIFQLEQIITKKAEQLTTAEDTIKRFEIQIQQLKGQNVTLRQSAQKHPQQISILERKLLDSQQTSQKKHRENLQNQKNQVTALIAKYEALIEDRVQQLQANYEKQLQSMRLHNMELLNKIQHEGQKKLTKNEEEFRKTNQDYTRIVEENKKLLSSINELKLKNIDLEESKANLTQQVRLSQKQKEYSLQNLKRELRMTKQEISQIQSKNKKLVDSNDEANWALKEAKLVHSEDLRRIRVEAQKQIKECLQNGLKNITKLQKKNQQLIEQNRKAQNQNLEKQKQIALLKDQLEREKKKVAIREEDQNQNRQLIRAAKEHKKGILEKESEIQALQEETKRLKLKVNKITTAYHQNLKNKEVVQKENKMLLSEIVFLRDRDNDKKKTEWSRVLDGVKSDVSKDDGVQLQELESYKQLIMEMEKDMTSALGKLQEKDKLIQKQKNVIVRLQRALELK